MHTLIMMGSWLGRLGPMRFGMSSSPNYVLSFGCFNIIKMELITSEFGNLVLIQTRSQVN